MNNCQKIKLLKLYELLKQQTDEEHPLRTGEICKKLFDMGITCDRRTLSRDIELLNEKGFEVMPVFIAHEKAYYVEDRSFSVPELKILLDAVQAAIFITEKKSEELIEKIANLGGSHRAEILKSNLVRFSRRKHTNESIFYNVDTLEQALQNKKKATFYYFDLSEKGERVYRKDKWRYSVTPLALIFSDDNYYLMTYHSKYGTITNYRVDRMEQVDVSEDDMNAESVSLMNKLAEYAEQAFLMYGGDKKTVTLEFDDSLLGVVYDKFGEETVITRVSEGCLRATVGIQVSPTFYGWLFQFVGKMSVVAPDLVKNDYIDRLNNALKAEKTEKAKT